MCPLVSFSGEERTEPTDFDYYETYFSGTQNILGSNDLYKSGNSLGQGQAPGDTGLF